MFYESMGLGQNMITNPASQAKYSFDGQVDVDLKMCERLLRFDQYYD